MAAKKSVADTIIDFAKEEGGGGGIRIKEGTYRAKIVKAVPTVSAEKATEGLAVTFQILDGKYRGKKITDTLWVSPKAYSRFRTLLEAVGADVPKRIKLSSIAAAVKGGTLYIEVQDEEREGYSARSRVTFNGFLSEDDYDPEAEDDDEDLDDEDEEDLDDEDEDDEETDIEDGDELDDMDRSELKAHIKANDLDVTVRKSMSDDDLRGLIRAADGDEDEDDEEEDEPEPPKRRSRAKKAAPAKGRARKRKKADDDEDLDELDLDDL